jgi:hypothetical protein
VGLEVEFTKIAVTITAMRIVHYRPKASFPAVSQIRTNAEPDGIKVSIKHFLMYFIIILLCSFNIQAIELDGIFDNDEPMHSMGIEAGTLNLYAKLQH